MSIPKPQVIPSRIFAVLVKFWWLVVLLALVGGGAAFAYSNAQTPIFHSTASVYFAMRSGTSGSDINQGSAYTQNQMLSFAQLAGSAAVLQEVKDDLKLDESISQIRKQTEISIPQNTVILDVTAGSSNRDAAAALANSVADNLATVVADVAPRDPNGASTVVARVIEPASPATFQSSPNKSRDALAGVIGGALLAILALTLWTLLDTRVRNADVLRRITPLPMLGAIPVHAGATRRPIFVQQPNSASAEAYRQVRSALRFAAVGHDIRAIAVTSSVPGEGKTTVAANIALSYAEAGLRVLLVDADLRRPMAAELLGLENAVGLTTVLVNDVSIERAIMTWGDGHLNVLTAGAVPPNPAELLASGRMGDVLSELRDHCDIMIVDTAPLLVVADASIIAPIVDAVIVVADSTRVRTAQFERTIASLDSVRASIAGIVLNRTPVPKRDNYYSQVEHRPGRRWGRKAQS